MPPIDMQLVEARHEQRGGEIAHLPQRADHAACAQLKEGGGKAHELVGVPARIVKPGLAGREHHEPRGSKCAARVDQRAHGEQLAILHQEAGLARVVPVEQAVGGEMPVAFALEPGQHHIRAWRWTGPA